MIPQATPEVEEQTMQTEIKFSNLAGAGEFPRVSSQRESKNEPGED
jgi:hypothetical protein